MKITISSQDLMKNRPLEPGWYDAKLVQFSTKPSADKGSTNFIFHVEIAKDQRIMEALFNSKALGMMEKAASVVSGVSSEIDPITNKPKPLEFEPDECIGHEFQVKLENEPFDGRVVSKIKDWLPKGVAPVLGGFTV